MKFLLCSLVLVSSCTATTIPPRSIDVVGHATMKVVPDMVELSLQAYNLKPAMKDAVSATENDVNGILAVCKKYVVTPQDIKITNISTNKAYDFNGRKEVFTGYDALQVLDVTLKDITKIEQFTEELLATRISKIDGIRYSHTKVDSLMREVNLMALEDANATAKKMCDKMNVSLGTVTHLSNFSSTGDEAGRNNSGDHPSYVLNVYNKSFGGQGFKMTTQILQLEDLAYATFELK